MDLAVAMWFGNEDESMEALVTFAGDFDLAVSILLFDAFVVLEADGGEGILNNGCTIKRC